MRISDWSSDVCSSDLRLRGRGFDLGGNDGFGLGSFGFDRSFSLRGGRLFDRGRRGGRLGLGFGFLLRLQLLGPLLGALLGLLAGLGLVRVVARGALTHARRIEEARNAVGRLRADTEPMVRAIGVELEALLVVLGEQRSEEHTSELQSLMRISYAVFCLKIQKQNLISCALPHFTSKEHTSLCIRRV